MERLTAISASGNLRNVILHGPPGSGKSAACECFARHTFGSAVGARVMRIDHSEATGIIDMRKLSVKINAFAKQKIRQRETEGGTPPFKIVLLDGICKVPPKNQQVLKNIMEEYEGTLRLLCTCYVPKKLVDYVKKSSIILKMEPLTIKLALKQLLKLCVRERIGYERRGIQEIMKHAKHDLGQAIRVLQKTFAEYNFVSKINAHKIINPNMRHAPPKVEACAALVPVEKCAVCLVTPPCQHISEYDLADRGIARRAELPREADRLVCENFRRTGACTVFNHVGHCSLTHPSNIHTVVMPTLRCRRCTLPVPCDHCRHEKVRTALKRCCDDSRTRFEALFNSMTVQYERERSKRERRTARAVRAAKQNGFKSEQEKQNYMDARARDKQKDEEAEAAHTLVVEELELLRGKIDKSQQWATNSVSIEEEDFKNRLKWIRHHCTLVFDRLEPVFIEQQSAEPAGVATAAAATSAGDEKR